MSTLNVGGAPDWTLLNSQDQRIIANFAGTLNGQLDITPVFYVGQLSHLYIYFYTTALVHNQSQIQVIYYSDAAGSNTVGFRQYTVDDQTTFGQLIPVVGLFAKVTLSHASYPFSTVNCKVLADSRGDAAGLFNKGIYLTPLSPTPLGAGGTAVVYLTPTVGGSGMLTWYYDGTNYTVQGFVKDLGGNSLFFINYTQATAPALRQVKLTWPPGLIALEFTNQDAASHNYGFVAVMD